MLILLPTQLRKKQALETLVTLPAVQIESLIKVPKPFTAPNTSLLQKKENFSSKLEALAIPVTLLVAPLSSLANKLLPNTAPLTITTTFASVTMTRIETADMKTVFVTLLKIELTNVKTASMMTAPPNMMAVTPVTKTVNSVNPVVYMIRDLNMILPVKLDKNLPATSYVHPVTSNVNPSVNPNVTEIMNVNPETIL
jgi:hypothetical protein